LHGEEMVLGVIWLLKDEGIGGLRKRNQIRRGIGRDFMRQHLSRASFRSATVHVPWKWLGKPDGSLQGYDKA